MTANEMDALLAKEGRKSKADQYDPLRFLAELFADAYLARLGDNAPRRITPDDLDDMADSFRDLIGEHYRV